MDNEKLQKYIDLYKKSEKYFDKFFENDKGCGCCAWSFGEIYFDQFLIKFINKCIEEKEHKVVIAFIDILFQYMIIYIKPVVEREANGKYAMDYAKKELHEVNSYIDQWESIRGI